MRGFKIGRNVRGNTLKKGQLLCAKYNKKGRESTIFLEVLEVNCSYQNRDNLESVKELLKFEKVRSLRALEVKQIQGRQFGKTGEEVYLNRSRITVRELETDLVGSWFYLYKGRWAVGCAPHPCSFYEIEEV